MKIGIISDTHGLLRPEVISALQGCEAILHGGDINRQEILDQLTQIAPIYAVRGNNDKEWAEHIPSFLEFTLAGTRIYMTHKRKDLPEDITAYDLVVFGHSHQYVDQRLENTLLLNPGSCGPRRFHQAITMATAEITEGKVNVTRIDIPHGSVAVSSRYNNEDIRRQIEIVVRQTIKGRSPEKIGKRYGMEISLAEQIARLYVTHPGVTIDGIMEKMGL